MNVTLTCPQCQQRLSADVEPGQQVRCGACGTVFSAGGPAPTGGIGYAPRPGALKTGMAIAALVCGIIGLVFCPIFGVLGIIFGIVALVKANNQPEEYGGKGMAIGGLCVGGASVLLIPVIIAVALPALSRARELAKRAVCEANLRGIGQSLYIYAYANDEWFPESMDDLVRLGHVTSGQLQCPSEADPSNASDYIYIPGLKRSAPADWVVVYEDLGNHGDGGNLVYVDGHVAYLKEPTYSEELQRVRAAIEQSEFGEHEWYRSFHW